MSSLINRHIAHLLWSDLLYFALAEYIIFFAIDLFTTRIYNTITKKKRFLFTETVWHGVICIFTVKFDINENMMLQWMLR